MDEFREIPTFATLRGQSDEAAHRDVPDPEKLRDELKYIIDSLSKLTGLKTRAEVLLQVLEKLKKIVDQDLPLRLRTTKLEAIYDIVDDLQLRIPQPYKLSSTDSHTHQEIQGVDGFDDLEVPDHFTYLHFHVGFQMSSAFQDFRLVYESLKSTTNQCLLCFAAILKNEIVKKRLMLYWWIGEGFLRPSEEGSEDKAADRILEELVKKACIEPVNGKGRFVVNSYRMNPFIRSAVIVLAKEAKFFDFDKETWDPVGIKASSGRSCLVNGFSQELVDTVYDWVYGSSKDRKQRQPKIDLEREPKIDLERVKTIFNVNEPYLDFYSPYWFSKMKKVKVLCLGRWQALAENHIVVKNTDFLKGLESMNYLNLLSLKGISRITELPDSVCKLFSLRILDLKACHNLEVLPQGIDSLKKLTHLDISECYMLDHMPKKIAFLKELQVFKGFLINFNSIEESCTLSDLSKLKKLRKLSIYTNIEKFPTYKDAGDFHKFEKLQKLIITWEAKGSAHNSSEDITADCKTTLKELGRLEKLELKCYPRMKAADWLQPTILPNLEKLYIIGGELRSLIPVQMNDEWKVKILRLKYLPDLKMDWIKLCSSFPHLTYLHHFDCPKLTRFPCTEDGVHLKHWSISELLQQSKKCSSHVSF